MEVEVANGAWRQGALLSVRVGDVRRQAALSCDTRIEFPKTIGDAEYMQVDVFARVGSTRVALGPGQDTYDLDVDGEGFSCLALRVRDTKAGAIERSLASKLFAGTDSPKASFLSADSTAVTTEERIARVRQSATEYIERHDLRMVMQDMFQQVIKERPENPYRFMLVFLQGHVADAPLASGASQPPPGTELDVASIEADAEEEARRQERERNLEYQIQVQRAEILTLRRQVDELSAADASKGDTAGDEDAKLAAVAEAAAERAAHAADKANVDREFKACKALVESQELQMQALRQRVLDLEAQAHPAAATAQEPSAAQLRSSYDKALQEAQEQMQRDHQKQLEAKQACIEMLQRQVQASERAAAEAAAMSRAGPLRRVCDDPRATPPADAAAGIPLVAQQADLKQAAQTLGSSTTVPSHCATGTGWFSQSNSGGKELNTHMLSQVLASSYAPPVPPALYYEPREDQPEEGAPMINPQLLIEVVECQDKATNGIFAWVGDCNRRPLYRLLSAEPRYLYYAEVDPTWAGWWVADKMGAEDYCEWFREPSNAQLPIYCRRGELGSRVVECELTREVVQKIQHISVQHEKVAIRKRLTEAFGAAFTKLEGSQRGLMSKTSPVVSVAHALEAQQRAIQLLHSQLSVETQRREAAESHALTMEEAFETLQLRMQAQFREPSLEALQAPTKAIADLLSGLDGAGGKLGEVQ